MTDTELLAIFDALPDLLQQAHDTRDTRDVYEVLRELEAEHVASGRAYVRSMPFRSPPTQCSTGEHQVASVEHRVIVPVLRQEAKLSARALHETREHRQPLPGDVIALLRRL